MLTTSSSTSISWLPRNLMSLLGGLHNKVDTTIPGKPFDEDAQHFPGTERLKRHRLSCSGLFDIPCKLKLSFAPLNYLQILVLKDSLI